MRIARSTCRDCDVNLVHAEPKEDQTPEQHERRTRIRVVSSVKICQAVRMVRKRWRSSPVTGSIYADKSGRSMSKAFTISRDDCTTASQTLHAAMPQQKSTNAMGNVSTKENSNRFVSNFYTPLHKECVHTPGMGTGNALGCVHTVGVNKISDSAGHLKVYGRYCCQVKLESNFPAGPCHRWTAQIIPVQVRCKLHEVGKDMPQAHSWHVLRT